eukprot:gene39835-48506_t
MYGIVDDNPNVKVMFSLRNPVKRAESQFRFDYLAYKEDGYGDINECIALALDPSKGKLSKWRENAVRALRFYHRNNKTLDTKNNPHLRELMKFYRRGLKKDSDFHYFRCGNLVLHSLYFLSVFAWMEAAPMENIRLLFTEFLDPRYMSEDLKRQYLALPPVIDQKISGVELWHRNNTKSDVIKRSFNASLPVRYATMTRLDRKYLVHQFNGIYRFMQLPQRKQMMPGGGHETPEVDLHMKPLNSTMKSILQSYFLPFDQLLDALLELQFDKLKAKG